MSYNETLKKVNARKKARIRERQVAEFKKTALKPVSDNIGLVVGATALATLGFASVNTSMVFADGVVVEDTVSDNDVLDNKKNFAVKNISSVHKPVIDTDKTEVKLCTAGFSANLTEISQSKIPTSPVSVDVIQNNLVKTTCAYQEKKEKEKKEEEKKALEKRKKEEKWNREVEYCKQQEVNVFENWRTNLGNGKSNSKTRTHMSYTAVTSHSSMQYKVLNSADAWSSEYTGLRMVGDRYCVAVGLKYGVAGDKIDLVMEDGSVVKAIIGDIKARKHTD